VRVKRAAVTRVGAADWEAAGKLLVYEAFSY
jgi:hypothetical protein